MKYQIRVVTDSYMDGDCWIENNGYWIEGTFFIAEDTTNKELVNFLYHLEEQPLYTNDLRKICVEDCGDIIEIRKKNGELLCYLVPMED